ncbi:MAG: 50S ribosomal protein L16 [Candidatus Aenigmatarchaeota archaeon]
MGDRPGRCYRDKDGKPYTRVSERNPRKSYIKGVPAIKTRDFENGDLKNKDDYELELKLTVDDEIQIRHNAIEAARVNANKYLLDELGEKNYFLKILVYPHHVLRENPLATGAGADRFQEGMTQAFGNPIGRAARMEEDQEFMLVRVPESNLAVAREALNRAKYKLPCSCSIKGLENYS